jgi:hypothetical protein
VWFKRLTVGSLKLTVEWNTIHAKSRRSQFVGTAVILLFDRARYVHPTARFLGVLYILSEEYGLVCYVYSTCRRVLKIHRYY